MEELSFLFGGIGLLVGLVAVVPMLTTRRRWVAALSLIAGVAFTIHGFYLLSSRDRITPENVESHVKAWLDAFSLKVQKRDNPECYFTYEVTLQTTIPVGVVRTKDHSHYITCLSTVSLAPEHKAFFSKLSDIEKKRFLVELQFEAAKAKIALEPNDTLDLLTIHKRLPITSTLTEADFMETINEVNYSTIIIRDTIGLKSDALAQEHDVKQPSPTPDTGASPH